MHEESQHNTRLLFTFNPLSANLEKWSNTLKQIVGNLPTICLSVFDHFMNLALKGLRTSNYELSYEELLDLTNGVSPHQRCLNSLMTEVDKCLNGISPDIMNNILTVSKHQYSTRHYNLFVTDRPKTDRFGRNSIPYRANEIWNLLPCQIKNSANLDSFKLKIKQ